MENLIHSFMFLQKNRNKYVELYLALDETSICALDHIYLLLSVS